ncbi:putative bifunctional diguanylate cyclase/phosphodiesterase [Sinorhizobium terangae]|uniref:EAL domain-containing protein n=1 Tax=Sinorhizobium terangae TaxID=110322 RepID=A0A6N7LHS8_SINTE|nr:EAL domain-containing protein [Sinorhizobium terangae]MBB4185341.1 diguanylate cyclase (GGDEF)-like protein/PAS domain S-box-containing protein [Sinorhizobium terangae]MQX17423.1 EAL domain-containing protein [Sinorhizobium terangae]WFU46581.1 EAL domain-containing protein [Sinorhizobium terangae]
MMHSVENRFVAIICGAMFVFVAPLLALFLTISSERVARERLQNIELLMEASGEALGKPIWDFDQQGIERIARSLMNATDIRAVAIHDAGGNILAQLPKGIGGTAASRSLKTAIAFDSVEGIKQVGTLEVVVPTPGILSRFSKDEWTVLAILLFAVAIVFAAALVGNRFTVIRPLMRLTAAIEATRRLGSRHRVDWISDDEMGTLAANFNEMQDRLEREETELKIAHERATETYNLTPAMLFSLDAANRLSAVSDYWLLATGYAREDVIGRNFTDFIDPVWHEAYRLRAKTTAVDNDNISEVTLPFRKADGEFMTVLILESEMAHGGDLSLSVMTDVTALKQAESRNHAQAITDHLTGLLNRQGFESALDDAIRNADACGMQLACLFIDLDRFKWINDSFGHAAGDAVLRRTVELVRATLAADDVMSRLGGDEFAILVAATDVAALAAEIGECICAALREPMPIAGNELSVSASVGVSVYPTHATSASDLLLKADMAMYARKRDGKNGLRIFDASMLDTARERHEIEQCIETGLKEDWFEAWLQPIVGLGDGQIVGFEALMRLDHPEKGLMPPGKIIGIAEETGTIGRIGDRVLEKAIRHLAAISALDGTQNTYLAVNFSPLQFELTLPHKLAALLLKHHISPQRIVIEITEAVLMLDNPEVHAVLKQLNEFGCRIALDDFGTGYSSLSYLNRFPVDIVKVDQSFTRSLSSGTADVRRKSRMLIKGIRTISHQMGCTVVAEGIETKEQWQLLRKLGVDNGQGYLFSRPMPIDGMLALLENESEAKAANPA